jgi:hypothetical protein
MEVNEFDSAVKMFHQRGAALDPVAAVEVLHVADGLDLGAVDVAADDAVHALLARHLREGFLVLGHKFHRGLGLELQVRGERPVAEAEGAAQAIEVQVEIENPVVQVRADLFEQVVEVREAVGLVAVRDEIFPPVRADVNDLLRERDAAEPHAGEFLHELVMIAGEVDDARLLAAFAEQFLDQDVVVVAPVPAEAQLPAVNQVADDVEVAAVGDAQEVEQVRDVRVFRAEVHVRNPDGTERDGLGRLLGVDHACLDARSLRGAVRERQWECGRVADSLPGCNLIETNPGSFRQNGFTAPQAKAVLKRAQSKRFARLVYCRSTRSVWTAAVHRRFSRAAARRPD